MGIFDKKDDTIYEEKLLRCESDILNIISGYDNPIRKISTDIELCHLVIGQMYADLQILKDSKIKADRESFKRYFNVDLNSNINQSLDKILHYYSDSRITSQKDKVLISVIREEETKYNAEYSTVRLSAIPSRELNKHNAFLGIINAFDSYRSLYEKYNKSIYEDIVSNVNFNNNNSPFQRGRYFR